MVYLNPTTLPQMHRDLSAFYDDALRAAASSTPPARPAAKAAQN